MSSPPRISPLRIAIVEDDTVLGGALVQTVNRLEGFVVDGWAQTLREGAQLVARHPDVLLVDLGLPDGSGLDLITVASQRDTLKILALSVFGDARHVVEAIERGADGYLLKGAEAFDVGEAVTMVLDGGAPISPAVAGHILQSVRRPSAASANRTVRLTAREAGVLEHLSKGLSFKEVANVEGISYHTVADHVKSIYRKLAVNSRSEAVFEAVQAGLIRLRD